MWLWTSVDANGNPAHGCQFTGAGNLNCDGAINGGSSRSLKHQFRPVNAETILRKVARLPVRTWSYRGDPSSVRHIGPVAEAFAGVFGLGASTAAIDVMDEAGVAFAAIRALDERSRQQARALAHQGREIRALRRSRALEGRGLEAQGTEIAHLGRRVVALEKEIRSLLRAKRR